MKESEDFTYVETLWGAVYTLDNHIFNNGYICPRGIKRILSKTPQKITITISDKKIKNGIPIYIKKTNDLAFPYNYSFTNKDRPRGTFYWQLNDLLIKKNIIQNSGTFYIKIEENKKW